MRISLFLRDTVLFLAAISPAAVRAQFQQFTQDELKMTSDPKAPGAAAVYLDVDENDELEQGITTFHARIKVLTEKGKELATVEIPYWKRCEQIALLKGRTIHPDGTVIPLAAKPEDLLIVKTADAQIERKVFTLPSVEVGSILEYHYDMQALPCGYYTPPSWDVQKAYFVHKAHYAYAPPDQQGLTVKPHGILLDENGNAASSVLSWRILPPGANFRVNPAGHIVLDLTDIPPVPNEEWMPPTKSFTYQVRFFLKSADNADDFWIRESKRWSIALGDFTKPTSSLRAAVASIVGPGDSDALKAKKLYDAVQALDNTDISRKKGESERRRLRLKDIERAQDVWEQRSGSGNEITLLYVSMLHAAGLTADVMGVVDRDEGMFSPGYMDIDQLDSFVVILSAGGKEIFLDPGEKMCPFGMLKWNHAGAGGIRDSVEGPEMGSTPSTAYTENSTLRTGDLTVDAQGTVGGNLRFVMTGQEALRWRQAALQNDEAEVKKQFDRELETIIPEGVEAHVAHFLAMDTPDASLIAVTDVKGTLGTATAKRLVLPGFFFGARGSEPFVQEAQRQTSVDMHYADIVTDKVTYRLPAGFAVEGAPQDGKILWKDHAVYSTKTVASPGRIDAARTVAHAFTLAKPEEYQDLRGFYQKVSAADQTQLVLAIAPAGKSN
jgi:hypothetical protein